MYLSRPYSALQFFCGLQGALCPTCPSLCLHEELTAFAKNFLDFASGHQCFDPGIDLVYMSVVCSLILGVLSQICTALKPQCPFILSVHGTRPRLRLCFKAPNALAVISLSLKFITLTLFQGPPNVMLHSAPHLQCILLLASAARVRSTLPHQHSPLLSLNIKLNFYKIRSSTDNNSSPL